MTTTTMLDTRPVFLLGVGTLLPFSVFITAKTYTMKLARRDDDGAAGSTNNNDWRRRRVVYERLVRKRVQLLVHDETCDVTLANRMRVFDNPSKRVTYDRLAISSLGVRGVFLRDRYSAWTANERRDVVSFATFNLVLFGILPVWCSLDRSRWRRRAKEVFNGGGEWQALAACSRVWWR